MTLPQIPSWVPPALEIPARYIQNGTPVFVAEPELEYPDRREFRYPFNWDTLKPDFECLRNWQPGWAVCAVTGVQFDVLDIDPRDGGHINLAGLEASEMLPEVYGKVLTPSGGKHLYISRTGLRKMTPWPGIDFQAGAWDGQGRGFVFITPTVRKDRRDGKLRVYTMREYIDFPGLRSGVKLPEARAFRGILGRIQKSKEARKSKKTVDSVFLSKDLTIEERNSVVETLEKMCSELAKTPPGARDNTLNSTIFAVGTLISGSGLDENLAKKALRAAGLATGLPESTVEYKLSRSLSQGKKRPHALPIIKEKLLEEYLKEYDAILNSIANQNKGGTS